MVLKAPTSCWKISEYQSYSRGPFTLSENMSKSEKDHEEKKWQTSEESGGSPEEEE